jgi:hypothetical protein
MGVISARTGERVELITLGITMVAGAALGIRYGIQYKEWWYDRRR